MNLWHFAYLLSLLLIAGIGTPIASAQQPVANLPTDAPIDKLPAEWFTGVSDRALGITATEREAYYGILLFANSLPAADFKQAAAEFIEQRRGELPDYKDRPASEFPLYRDMFRNPDAYRGRPVTLSGNVRSFIQIAQAETNPVGVDLFEGWLYTDDAMTNPAVFICTERPDGLPEGGEITEQVTVTGYFFKKYGYQAQDTTRLAPMLLAGPVTWTPTPPPPRMVFPIWAYVLMVVLFGTAVYYVFRSFDSDHKRSRSRQRRESAPPPIDLDLP